MKLNYRPRLNIGRMRIGKTGVSFRTGIPGVTVRHDFKKGSPRTSDTTSSEDAPYGIGKAIVKTIVFGVQLALATLAIALFSTKWLILAPALCLFIALSELIKSEQANSADPDYYTSSQLLAKRVEGALKLLLVIGALYVTYPAFTSTKAQSSATTKIAPQR